MGPHSIGLGIGQASARMPTLVDTAASFSFSNQCARSAIPSTIRPRASESTEHPLRLAVRLHGGHARPQLDWQQIARVLYPLRVGNFVTGLRRVRLAWLTVRLMESRGIR